MFDELDDPAYAGPPPGVRDAVVARAGRIRRTRRLTVASGVASLVLLLVGAVVLRGPDPEGQTGIEPVASPSATATAQESPTPSPSPTATTPPPTRTATPRPTTPPDPPVIVGPTTSATPHRQPEVDVVSGWLGSRAIDSCDPATSLPPRQGRLERSGISMVLDVPATIDGTDPPPGRLVFRNDTDQTVVFNYLGSGGGPVHSIAAGHGAFSGATYVETISRENSGGGRVTLNPGETESIEVTLLTDTCAQGRTLAKRNRPTLLAPGMYQLSVGIMVTDAVYWSPSPDPGESPSASPSGPFRPDVYSTVPVTVTIR